MGRGFRHAGPGHVHTEEPGELCGHHGRRSIRADCARQTYDGGFAGSSSEEPHGKSRRKMAECRQS
jgi:hypothetical protein